jgi:hypothetical protein
MIEGCGHVVEGCGSGQRRPHSGALSTVAAGAPQAHRPHVHSLPGAKFSRRLFHTSAGMPVDLRSRPRIISRARSARQALTRRCNVRSCALPAYASGNIVANRFINSLPEADGSAISQPSTSGHASANGSTFVRHQCLAPGCLHAWVEPVHSSTPWTGS